MIDELLSAIKNNDRESTLSLLTNIKGQLETNLELVNQITAPNTITELHNCMVENMNVPRRALQLRVRIPSRGKRAFAFVQGMINGVNLVK
jgi:hypothetical protein